MKKKMLYWMGLPIVFVALVASTFLREKTYESTMILAKEDQRSKEYNRVMTLNRPENYDLGLVRTENAISSYAYEEVIHADDFIRRLLDINVRTMKGDWEGTYYNFCTEYNQSASAKEKPVVHQDLPWTSIKEELVAKQLKNSIHTEVDYETEILTVRVVTNDPLVSTMLATGVKEQLQDYVAEYEQQKMEIALSQLHALTEAAKADWEQDKSAEKEERYKSFERQEVVYRAQMMYIPAFTVVSEPSFSYIKAAPNRWKMPLAVTLLAGLALLGWEHKEKVKKYIKG